MISTSGLVVISNMTITILFLWQLADITSSVWKSIHGRNDELYLIPISFH